MAEGHKKISQLSASTSPDDRAEAQRLIQNPPAELIEQVRRLADEFAKSGRVAYVPEMTMLGLESIPPDPAVSDNEFMLSWLSWFRYGKSFPQLTEERKTDPEASQQYLSVLWDFERWRFGKLDSENLKFKTDRQHWTLLASGLNFGIVDLTAEELADFCNEMCPCGEQHSPENLRKLRERIIRAIRTFRPGSSGSQP